MRKKCEFLTIFVFYFNLPFSASFVSFAHFSLNLSLNLLLSFSFFTFFTPLFNYFIPLGGLQMIFLLFKVKSGLSFNILLSESKFLRG